MILSDILSHARRTHVTTAARLPTTQKTCFISGLLMELPPVVRHHPPPCLHPRRGMQLSGWARSPTTKDQSRVTSHRPCHHIIIVVHSPKHITYVCMYVCPSSPNHHLPPPTPPPHPTHHTRPTKVKKGTLLFFRRKSTVN